MLIFGGWPPGHLPYFSFIMKRILSIILLLSAFCLSLDAKKPEQKPQPEIMSQWYGAKVAFLGDSITDKGQLSINDVYWNQLSTILGIEPYCYGINGNQTVQVIDQAKKLNEEHGQDVDAIIIFIGTNDFNSSFPLGEWYTEDTQVVNRDGQMTVLRHRTRNMEGITTRSQINIFMSYLKHTYPTKQIILLTPIHRAYFNCWKYNVQPDESFANPIGLYIDDYIKVIKETSDVWAVPVIDLAAVCGLFPLEDEHIQYFREAGITAPHTAVEASKAETETEAALEYHDLLHPNTKGHLRMAYSIAYQLLGYPAKFE